MTNEVLPLLSKREKEVLRLLGCGLSDAEVGQVLKISERTVAVHSLHARKKIRASGFNITNRSQLTLYVIRAGLISLEQAFAMGVK
jgi:DNA-binding NarL/FixJ family response regulator